MRPTGSGAKSPSILEASKNRHGTCRIARAAAGRSSRSAAGQIMLPWREAASRRPGRQGRRRRCSPTCQGAPAGSSSRCAQPARSSSDLPSRRDRWRQARCGGVDGDAAAIHFLGRDHGQGFHCRLGRSIDTIGFKLRAGTLVEKLMTRPPPRRRLAAPRSVLKVPLRLTSICRVKWVSSASASDESIMLPASFTSTSTSP